MPFTPAHPAIVLPFMKSNTRYVSASALVFGSMAPDFEYFFRMAIKNVHGHTFWGLIYFNIPVTVFLALCFHVVVKHNLIANLPQALQARFQTLLHFDFIPYLKDRYLVVILCAWAGAGSHLLWDSFTHHSGYFAKLLGFTGNNLAFPGPLYAVLQHLSTLAGLAIISIYIALLKPVTLIHKRNPSLNYWIKLLLITLGVVVVRFSVKAHDLTLGNAVVSTISGFCIAVFLMGLRKRTVNIQH
jgi:hypothetical protein